jgi:hypothetical protein
VNRFTIILFPHHFNNKFTGVMKFPDLRKKGSPLQITFGKSEMLVFKAMIPVKMDGAQERRRLIQPILLGAVRPKEMDMPGVQTDPESGVGQFLHQAGQVVRPGFTDIFQLDIDFVFFHKRDKQPQKAGASLCPAFTHIFFIAGIDVMGMNHHGRSSYSASQDDPLLKAGQDSPLK